MKIKQETLDHFARKNICVRWYPETSYDDFNRRCWEHCYDFAFNYGKDHVRGSKAVEEGTANVLYETMDDFKEHCRLFADKTVSRTCDPYKYDTLYIEYDGKLIVKKEPVKSREITIGHIEGLIERNEKAYRGAYGRFALQMRAILKANGLGDTFNIYPTTYGIGVLVYYNLNAGADIKRVTDILDGHGVEYYNEYSDARWVYRFKVSKDKNNLKKIAA